MLYPYLDWWAALVVTAVVLIILALQQRERWSWLAANWLKTAVFLTTALGFLALYIVTLAPDLLPADNGEYQLVATTLGVAHPPGFPFYTLFGHVFTRLPFGPTPAYRLNLLSAFSSTAALLLTLATVYRLTKSYLGGITAVLALASATTFWAQATTANIRSLTALFAALAIYALIAFRQASQAQNRRQADRFLILFALALGFGLGASSVVGFHVPAVFTVHFAGRPHVDQNAAPLAQTNFSRAARLPAPALPAAPRRRRRARRHRRVSHLGRLPQSCSGSGLQRRFLLLHGARAVLAAAARHGQCRELPICGLASAGHGRRAGAAAVARPTAGAAAGWLLCHPSAHHRHLPCPANGGIHAARLHPGGNLPWLRRWLFGLISI
ncbi:MAG: DUF2723 domain-containing protein [Chloroflexi bacterium]|nr:DUF2723 domain-containing protein [Chloroflexota bacterium]